MSLLHAAIWLFYIFMTTRWRGYRCWTEMSTCHISICRTIRSTGLMDLIRLSDWLSCMSITSCNNIIAFVSCDDFNAVFLVIVFFLNDSHKDREWVCECFFLVLDHLGFLNKWPLRLNGLLLLLFSLSQIYAESILSCAYILQICTIMHLLIISERELTFTFAICYRPSVCLSSVDCLSVVCNARAPYSGGSNFPQYFYGIWYLGHPLTSTENFTEIVPGEPLRRGS